MLKLFYGSLIRVTRVTIQKLAPVNYLKNSQKYLPVISCYSKDDTIKGNMSESATPNNVPDGDSGILQNQEGSKRKGSGKRRHKKKGNSESENIPNNEKSEQKPANMHKRNGYTKHNRRPHNDNEGNNPNSSERNHPNVNHDFSDSVKGNRPYTGQSKSTPQKNKIPEMNFENYISFEHCSEGLKRGELIKGVLRINPRSFQDAYVDGESGDRDIKINGIEMRNRSLPGDIVAIKLLPEEDWPKKTGKDGVEEEGYLHKTGKVVYIIEKKHPRVAAGHLHAFRNHAFGFALMSPVDSRLPRIMIPFDDCPVNFKKRPKDFEKTLFVGRIMDWGLNMPFASGKLMRSLGEAGHIEPETEAILASNDIDSSDFQNEVLRCLPDGKTWEITKEELAKRKDLRDECIFSIDPATARDLDDALSCKKIGDNLYEVGVHIADVSHFIEQQNALDDVAKSRATSVYLAQKVIPMLPRVLCEQLCSLNPGVERLAYSVIWNLKSDGTIVREWFGRSVIKSCMKLSYDHAQQMIDNKTEDIIEDEFPEVHGNFTLKKISGTVKNLYAISAHLRKNRFDSGALKIDMPKLAFALDDESGLPNGCRVYEYKNSNELIEEFMLLANMAVGRQIYKAQPKIAILRLHPPPQESMMSDLQQVCEKFDIPFDIRDSASINKSLRDVIASEVEGKEHIFPALTLMCAKPFQNAKYFCTGSLEDESLFRHYALNVPIYTHFTSPIRRYPDIMVHRLLTASLKPNFKVNDDVKELQTIADHCNDKKWAAKKASEQSSLLYFAIYIKECGPITEKGVVVGILSRAIDVLSIRLGLVNRVYTDQLSVTKHDFKNDEDELKPQMTLYWRDDKATKEGSLDERLAALTKQFEEKWQHQNKNKGNGSSKCDETTENESSEEGIIKQELSIFSNVDLILTVKENAPTKILATILNPHDVNENPEHGL